MVYMKGISSPRNSSRACSLFTIYRDTTYNFPFSSRIIVSYHGKAQEMKIRETWERDRTEIAQEMKPRVPQERVWTKTSSNLCCSSWLRLRWTPVIYTWAWEHALHAYFDLHEAPCVTHVYACLLWFTWGTMCHPCSGTHYTHMFDLCLHHMVECHVPLVRDSQLSIVLIANLK